MSVLSVCFLISVVKVMRFVEKRVLVHASFHACICVPCVKEFETKTVKYLILYATHRIVKDTFCVLK